MSSLGRLANSLFSVNNENTLTLANLNVDFTLFKFEAPKEFRTIGTSLSLRRRDDAEQGKIHKTARKLGALFEALVPSTPNLLKAYGTRSSEIASDPDANPKGSQDHGPFADFVGIDGSSLWAAATSGTVSAGTHAALSMHLLACMLARAWEAGKAISIWAELVNERQTEIAKSIDDGPQFIPTCMAARQDITREELAIWDASARSWLQSADEVKRVAQTKLMLIVKNISVDVGQGKTTYQNVIGVWRHALLGMENLVQGRPQEASDGSVLLALSAWHIYPNLIVLGSPTKSVEFNDPLVQAGGTITIGLQYASDGGDMGMRWSLTLSQYRFYEREAEVDTGDGTDRVSMDELLIVALASLFSAWEIPKAGEIETAEWLIKIFDVVNKPASFQWLGVLAHASHKFLILNTENEAHCSELIAWGRRRAKNLLGFQAVRSDPFFGLCRFPLLQALSVRPGIESGILHLRAVAQTMNIEGAQYVIRYREQTHDSVRFVLATAFPHLKRSPKRTVDGFVKYEETHYRWIPPKRMMRRAPPCFKCVTGFQGCGGACRAVILMDCLQGCSHDSCHHPGTIPRSDQCIQYDVQDISDFPSPLGYFIWRNPPPLVRHRLGSGGSPGESCPTFNSSQADCRCAHPCPEVEEPFHGLIFKPCYGNPEYLSLHVQMPVTPFRDIEADDARKRAELASNSLVSVKEAIMLLDERKINSESLCQYLSDYDSIDSETQMPQSDELYHRCVLDLQVGYSLDITHFRALAALAIAETIFASFEGFSMPLRITSISLGTCEWIRHRYVKQRSRCQIYSAMSLAERFACIVTFGSCVTNIRVMDCEEIIAVSFGNSIFVASSLLSDPINSECWDKVQRLTGNVGMPGISLMIPPRTSAKFRALSHDLRVVPHCIYNNNRENNFQGTSLHLSFTNWRRPYEGEEHGTIDESIFFVESVVSVHDHGKWVADLDILGLEPSDTQPWVEECCCKGKGDGVITSIDCWEEVLDQPENVGVVRAYRNWAARLAVLGVSLRKADSLHKADQQIWIVDPHKGFCPKCIPARILELTGLSTGLVID